MTHYIRITILPFLLLIVLHGFSQTPTHTTKRFYKHYPEHYHILSFNYGLLFPVSPGGNGKTNIPYTAVDPYTGDSEPKSLNGTTRNVFSNQMLTLGIQYETIFRNTNDIVIGIGGFNSKEGSGRTYIHAGYRYVLNLGWLDLKPGMDFYYFGGSTNTTTIDNYNKDIYIDKLQALAQFSKNKKQVFTDEDGNTYEDMVSVTYNADRLEARYARRAIALQPILEATMHWRKLSVSVEAGYIQQIKQNSKMIFKQVNIASREHNAVGSIPMRGTGGVSGPKLSIMTGFAF